MITTTVRSRTFPSRSLKITSRCPSSRSSAAFASASFAVSTMTPTAPTPLRVYTWYGIAAARQAAARRSTDRSRWLAARRMPWAIVKRTERFKDIVDGDGCLQALGRPQRWARCDSGRIRCPGRQDRPLFREAEAWMGNHLLRVLKRSARMKERIEIEDVIVVRGRRPHGCLHCFDKLREYRARWSPRGWDRSGQSACPVRPPGTRSG